MDMPNPKMKIEQIKELWNEINKNLLAVKEIIESESDGEYVVKTVKSLRRKLIEFIEITYPIDASDYSEGALAQVLYTEAVSRYYPWRESPLRILIAYASNCYNVSKELNDWQ